MGTIVNSADINQVLQDTRPSSLHQGSDDSGEEDNKTQSTQSTKYLRVEGRILGEREYIGAECMFKPGTCEQTISSVDHSELLRLAHSDIESLQQEFPDL